MSELLSNWDLAEAFYALDHAAPCDSAEWQASHRIRAHIYALTARAEAAERERDEAREERDRCRALAGRMRAAANEAANVGRAVALEEAAQVAESTTDAVAHAGVIYDESARELVRIHGAQIAAAIRALNPRHVRDHERVGDGPAERKPDAGEEVA